MFSFCFFPLRNSYWMTLPPPHFRFAFPKTKDCAEFQSPCSNWHERVFPCFNWKPVLVTFQVWQAVFFGVPWLITFCLFLFSLQKNSDFLLQAFFGAAHEFGVFSRKEWPVAWPAAVGRVLWLPIVLESSPLSLRCVWGRASHSSGLGEHRGCQGTL